MKRRFALFADIAHEYMLVITEVDFETAPRWGGFVRWVGGVRMGYGSEYWVSS